MRRGGPFSVILSEVLRARPSGGEIQGRGNRQAGKGPKGLQRQQGPIFFVANVLAVPVVLAVLASPWCSRAPEPVHRDGHGIGSDLPRAGATRARSSSL